MLRRASLTALALIAATVTQALELPLPQGARVLFSETSPQAGYALPSGAIADGVLPTVPVEGSVSREAWRVDNEAITNLQVIAPIRAALEAERFDILLDCADLACGGFDFRFATDVLPPPAMFVDLGDFRFLSARQGDNAIGLLVSGTSNARFIQIIRVGALQPTTVTPVAVQAAPADIEGIGAALETSGRVVLDDLAFETGSATLSDGPYATLEALGRYLKANPNRTIALVGHTDAVGGLEGNIALSRRRAVAVLERLADTYGVPKAQMEAGGMGYLAPRTNNLSAEGRARNRRVEAVLTSTE